MIELLKDLLHPGHDGRQLFRVAAEHGPAELQVPTKAQVFLPQLGLRLGQMPGAEKLHLLSEDINLLGLRLQLGVKSLVLLKKPRSCLASAL